MRDAKGWHDASHLTRVEGPLKFRRVGLGTVVDAATVKGIIKNQDGPEGVSLEWDGDGDAVKGVLTSGPVTFPRHVKVLANSDPTYSRIVSGFLRDHGVRGRARITRIVAADLDGKRTHEVIIEASSRDDLLSHGMNGARAGDYSLVLLRYIHGGKVVEKPLLFDHPKPNEMPYLNRIQAVADFDGSGNLEFVLSSDYYEGISASLWQFKAGKLSRVVENGEGA